MFISNIIKAANSVYFGDVDLTMDLLIDEGLTTDQAFIVIKATQIYLLNISEGKFEDKSVFDLLESFMLCLVEEIEEYNNQNNGKLLQ